MKLVEVSKNDKIKTLSKNLYFDELQGDILKSISVHTQLREYERGDVLSYNFV